MSYVAALLNSLKVFNKSAVALINNGVRRSYSYVNVKHRAVPLNQQQRSLIVGW